MPHTDMVSGGVRLHGVRHGSLFFPGGKVKSLFLSWNVCVNPSYSKIIYPDAKIYLSVLGRCFGIIDILSRIWDIALMLCTHQHLNATPQENHHASKYGCIITYLYILH